MMNNSSKAWIADPQKSLYPVRIVKGEWVDASRDGRAVPYKIYYPEVEPQEPLPVVVWSHGMGGTRDGASFLARYMAGNGYVIVHVQHFGTDDSLWAGKPGHPWDNIKKAKITAEDALNRYRDVPFALDQLEASSFDGFQMDFSRVGMSGHSFGANTTQIMAGQQTGWDEELIDMHEPRFKAGIVYSPVPSSNKVRESHDIYHPIRMPLFHMTGTHDDSPIGDFGHEHRLLPYELASHDDQHLLVLEEGDHMVFSGSRGQLPAYDKLKDHEDIIKVVSLAWWDAWLRDDERAHTWLRDEFQHYLEDHGTHSFRS